MKEMDKSKSYKMKKIVKITNGDFKDINECLKDGWKVKQMACRCDPNDESHCYLTLTNK